jgi:hypothetical protein
MTDQLARCGQHTLTITLTVTHSPGPARQRLVIKELGGIVQRRNKRKVCEHVPKEEQGDGSGGGGGRRRS